MITILEGESLSKEKSEELAKWLENLLGKQKVAGVKVLASTDNRFILDKNRIANSTMCKCRKILESLMGLRILTIRTQLLGGRRL